MVRQHFSGRKMHILACIRVRADWKSPAKRLSCVVRAKMEFNRPHAVQHTGGCCNYQDRCQSTSYGVKSGSIAFEPKNISPRPASSGLVTSRRKKPPSGL